MNSRTPRIDFRTFYDRFDAPVATVDCGRMCAPHHPNRKPFCCDICCAVPAVYLQEWDYLRQSTDLWQEWRGDECPHSGSEQAALRSETPENMRLLACQGPDHCLRRFRSISCREFPFFPYITSDYRFVGLAYDWTFENTCWVISHLGNVTVDYRREFVQAYDDLFSLWPEEMDAYAELSASMREYFAAHKRRFPLLHRRGGFYWVSPLSQRLRVVSPDHLPRFGPYR